MSACVEENLLETGSIPPRSGSVEEAVAGMGKAATLAEWVYAGLRVETRDWSAELRKSAEVTLPKFAMLESSVENTGSIAAHSSAETAGPMRGTVTTVGVSGPAHFGLDQMVAGVRDAKVMGGEGHAAGIAVQHVGQQLQAVVATSSSFMADIAKPAPVVVETPVVAAPVVEVVVPSPVVVEAPVVEVVAPAPVVIEAPVVAAPVVEVVVPAPVVVETPVVEVVAPAPVVVEEPVVAAPVVEVVAPAPVVIEAPVVAAPVVELVVPASVVVEPVVEAAAPVEALRTYIHEFTPAHEMIRIDAAFGHDFADLLTKAVIYMNEESTVIELNDGSDMVILTHFQMTDLKPEMLSFDADGSSKFTIETPVIETPISPEATADVFDFSLNAGRVYVNGFDQGVDTIFIHSDLFNNYAELLERTNIYQDGTSTVIELHNGDDMIILPHFSMKELNAGMFTFEAEQFLGATAIELGTAGDDTMIFGTGDQTIDPGQGFDVVTGGVGNDTFIFNATSGHDFIVDFHAGEDHIQIGSDLGQDFDDMMEHASVYQDGTSTQIEFSNGQMITLYNTDAAAVSAEWFSFKQLSIEVAVD